MWWRRTYTRAISLGIMVAALGSIGIVYYTRDAGALWRVIHHQCAVHPLHAPCAVYAPDRGIALLKDRRGQGQYLLLPLQRLTGIESPLLLNETTPNYLAEAWAERHWVSEAYGRIIPDDHLSLAVNSAGTRSQNQLHIHIDCVQENIFHTLQSYETLPHSGDISLNGRSYHAMMVPSAQPPSFYALRKEIFSDEDEKQRGRHGIFVMALGAKGFLVLEETTTHDIGFGGIERLQDHQCRGGHSSSSQ